MTAPFHPATYASGLHLLGEGVEVLDVSVERQWENLLDWEHLPYLHPGSFGGCTFVEGGRWWWRARVGDTLDVCLVIDPDALEWGIVTEGGGNPGSFIFLNAEVLAPRSMRVRARFLTSIAPKNPAAAAATAHFLKRQFSQLAREDGAAMLHRQDALDHLALGTTDALGAADDARARAPFVARWRGTRFWIRAQGPAFVASAADCPHMLGPLPCPTTTAEVVCPWHAYRFDVATGRSCDGHGLRLRPPPDLVVHDGELTWGA